MTEFVAGSSLLKEIETGCGVPMATVRDYCQQLLDVLAYLHGKSIMHKDLKVFLLIHYGLFGQYVTCRRVHVQRTFFFHFPSMHFICFLLYILLLIPQLSSVFLDQDKTIRLADYSVGKRYG